MDSAATATHVERPDGEQSSPQVSHNRLDKSKDLSTVAWITALQLPTLSTASTTTGY